MKKSIWIRIVAMLLVIVLTGCSTPTMGPVDSQPQTDSSTTGTNGQENETTESTGTTENTEDPVDPTTNTETVPTEDELSNAQKNSIAMLNYLTVTAEEICVSKNNRLMLEDIYSALTNYINPGAVDEDTRDYLEDLKFTIKDLLTLDSKRTQLQYIYNQNKASAMKEAVPDPLAILSVTNSLDWKRLATGVAFTIVDSYNNYKTAIDSAEQEYLLSGWDLDIEEEQDILDSQNTWFTYMQKIVDKYGAEGNTDKLTFGKLTLSREDVSRFAQICAESEVYSKIQSLEASKETYKLFGNYWLELANCYYEIGENSKCLDCIEEYTNLDSQIFRKDYNVAAIMPKVIDAAHSVYSEEEYITIAPKFAKAIIDNTSDSDWAVRYFAAQTYLDLYAKTNNNIYLEEAYNIALNNVNELKKEQETLNKTYLSDVALAEMPSVDDGFLTKEEKESLKKQQKEEKKRIDAYNKALEKTRETELPPLYEPLVLNCDLLFALAKKMDIIATEQTKISKILKTETNGIFLSDPINQKYSFNPIARDYTVDISKESIIVPADLLTQGATLIVTVVDGDKSTVFDDFEVKAVERTGDSIDTFKAEYSSKKMKDYKWSADAKITIEIINSKYCDPVVLNYKVKEYKENWIFPDSVTFEKA